MFQFCWHPRLTSLRWSLVVVSCSGPIQCLRVVYRTGWAWNGPPGHSRTIGSRPISCFLHLLYNHCNHCTWLRGSYVSLVQVWRSYMDFLEEFRWTP